MPIISVRVFSRDVVHKCSLNNFHLLLLNGTLLDPQYGFISLFFSLVLYYSNYTLSVGIHTDMDPTNIHI